MKRGGIALAFLLAISGVLRIAGPGSPTGPQTPGLGSGAAGIRDSAKSPQSTYRQDLYSTIQDFYGYWPDATTSAPQQNPHVTVPECARSEIQFVVAILPDPVHTRLGLFFDRSIEALQQAAQKMHYSFDRAVLPWDRNSHSNPSEPKARQEAAAEQSVREAFPGLLIFRDGYETSGGRKPSEEPSPSSTADDCFLHHKPLFVFVVGETPTGGVRKKQFRNTLQILREIRGPQNLAPGVVPQPLRLLGPSFSGSLDSLASLLHQDADRHSERDPLAPVFVYSGTVTSRSAMDRFKEGHFVSFLENDDYSIAQFIRFAVTQGFRSDEIAVLSEDETEYGTPSDAPKSADQDVVHLHFPREISYFRSAYQKEIVPQQQLSSSLPPAPGRSTLPLDLNESGNDDDSVPPYDVVQTSLSQESAMLGVISELRTYYPQGRVVITAPDLLLCREQDTLLHGVLGLNTYPLLPGLDDSLGQYHDESTPPVSASHEDRLFVSSLSVGEFNAMAGLLAIAPPKPGPAGGAPGTAAEKSARLQPFLDSERIPGAPYAEYAPPAVRYGARADAATEAPHKPLLWLTILGRDGYWPLVALTHENLASADGLEPIAPLPVSSSGSQAISSTLRETTAPLLPPKQASSDTPPSWNLALCLCLTVLSLHAILSLKGSALADSQSRAQFARDSRDCRGAVILALGAFALSSAFVLILLTRCVRVTWDGSWVFSAFLWFLYSIFVVVTFLDLSNWRGQPGVGMGFLISVAVMTALQLWLALAQPHWARIYWSTRIIHLDSGLSPVLPVLLLLAGGYWWMWMSLRAIVLVDLRRPRLPEQKDLSDAEADDVIRPKLPDAKDLNAVSRRISDEEGEQLREVAHPFYVKWQVLLPVIILFLIPLTVLDLKHPLQSIEGHGYDWGYTLLLCVLLGTFLGSLLKLVFAWMKCRQILAGLDRLPLREAFDRMKDLSWHSFWNPGGSTLRETYKIMSRSIQNLERLRPLLDAKSTTLSDAGRQYVCTQIDDVFEKRDNTIEKYRQLFEIEPCAATDPRDMAKGPAALLHKCFAWVKRFFAAGQNRADKEQALMKTVESLQRQVAKTAAAVMRYTLVPFWTEEPLPVVSVDARIKKDDLPAVRALAEEFAALVYVNFLVSVLLRLRTFVICVIGLYVCIVVSISVYPFEPHPALQAMAVILLIVMGVAVGYVYAEMHREAILSKLTSTNAGELGWDFWLKFASAGAIPLFSLLAAQFPGLNKLLFNWLEPALNAVR